MKAFVKNERHYKSLLEKYEKSFKIIYGIYGEISVEELIEELQRREAETFALYSYIGEVNKQIEQVLKAKIV